MKSSIPVLVLTPLPIHALCRVTSQLLSLAVEYTPLGAELDCVLCFGQWNMSRSYSASSKPTP